MIKKVAKYVFKRDLKGMIFFKKYAILIYKPFLLIFSEYSLLANEIKEKSVDLIY
ncbi:hypothetical protein [Candidatus Williamhamiltonella defendens]|uniref:hypothetical protein n=1 Tax=Candidatus Williamhamiltonella defendens TaxID=138072 RepID=UPI001C9D8BD6|nr:hypothetical protein [Candidatus Hamiltonella defensa]